MDWRVTILRAWTVKHPSGTGNKSCSAVMLWHCHGPISRGRLVYPPALGGRLASLLVDLVRRRSRQPLESYGRVGQLLFVRNSAGLCGLVRLQCLFLLLHPPQSFLAGCLALVADHHRCCGEFSVGVLGSVASAIGDGPQA